MVFHWMDFLSYVFAASFSPGPNTIMSLSNGTQLGFKKTIPFLLGIWSGLSIVAVCCGVFCNLLSEVIPKIKTPMLILGAIYILYLAYKTFKRSSTITEKEAKTGFWFGFSFQFINPKVYLYLIMSLEAYVLPSFQGQWDKIIFFSLFLSTFAFFVDICYALFGSAFKTLFSKYAKVTNTIMALLLVYCAIKLFL